MTLNHSPAGLTIDCWKLNPCMCGSELITTCLATLRVEKQARIRCHSMWGRMSALICVPVYVGWKLIGVDHQTSSRVAISNSWCSKFRSFVVLSPRTNRCSSLTIDCHMHHLKSYSCHERDVRVPTTYIPADTWNCTLMFDFFGVLCSLQWVLQLFRIQDIARRLGR